MILRLLAVWLVLFVGPVIAGRAAVPKPAKGWSMELVAQAPEVSHPSVVTTAPDGRVFVAEDPMDIREDVRPDAKAGRIWCLHPDGRRTLFAKDLHAVFGMQHLEGKLYVLHNPFLTVFRDDDGVGREPVDLLTHTLREPWGLGWNDHVPANFKLGMDGFFYLAVGDKGLEDCTGTDGRQISMPGGGVVRFRPDGSGLEIFATGVRNILDVALDEDDEPFTYDNTDEHQWMGRLTHMVEAGFYGYPHDFIPRRPYTLWMMHDFGAGAACGTLCATDDGLPTAMSGNLFLSDFGKRQVTRVTVVRDGASFRVASSEELFPEPPDDFRPVGIGGSVDGRSMFICDWQHRDQKADVSVGRLWKLSWTGGPEAKAWPKWWQGLAMGRPDTMEAATPELVAALSHPARSVRLTAQRALVARARRPEGAAITVRLGELLQDPGASGRARKHALWALDGIDEGVRGRPMVTALAAGADPSLAAQALRQLSQRRGAAAVPVAIRALKDAAAPVRLQAATLLGRTADTNSVPPLMASLGTEADGVVRFAVFNALRRIMEAHDETASAVVAGLASSSSKVREGCANALHDLCSVTAVARLARIVAGPDVAAAKAAMEVLAPLARRAPAVRDAWWAYHPADSPPPARTLDWAGTPSVVATLRTSLDHPDAAVRGLAVVALGDVGDTVSSGALRRRLAEDPVVAVRLSALASLAKIDPAGASDSAAAFLVADAVPELRQAALRQLAVRPRPGTGANLRKLLADGAAPEKPLVLRAMARAADPSDISALIASAKDPALRDLAIRALAAAPALTAVPLLLEGVASPDPAVAQDSRKALAKLGAAALPELVKRAGEIPAGVRGTLRDVFKGVPEAKGSPLFASLPAADPAAYAEFAKSHPGDPWRGQQIFFGAAGVACNACHQVAGHGGLVGPDLTSAGRQFGRPEIIESILYPGRIVREGYRQTEIVTTDDREWTGIVKNRSPKEIALTDVSGTVTVIPLDQVKERRELPDSMMPDELHAGLTLDQFADLVAFVASRTSDPRTQATPPLPEGFTSLFNGRDLEGWRTTDQNRAHWTVKDGRILHDGIDGDLWHDRDLVDFELWVEWRWPELPKVVEFPVIDADGRELTRTERVLDAGDSGVFVRGLHKAQANLFCYPVGSGEFWEYRSSLQGGARRAVTPSARADAPIGDWNAMRVTVQGDRVGVVLNGQKVISAAHLPGLPARGPIGLQHEHGRLEVRTVAVRVLP